MSYSVCLSICLLPAAAFHSYCPHGFGNNFRRKYTQSREICQSSRGEGCQSRVQIMGSRPRRLIHVCKITPFALVVLHGCCPELRQEPAKLRVLRNSPRAMPLFGLPIIVMSARYTSRKQGKLQRACACKCHVVHGCRSGSFALVIPLLHCHGCRSRVFAHVGFNEC